MTPVYYFTIFAVIPLGALVLMLLLAPKLKRMMHGVH